MIGLAYPLFNAYLPLYLNDRFATSSSVSTVYRNYVIISVMGIPGSILACLIVDWTRKSRKDDSTHDRELDRETKRIEAEGKPFRLWDGLTVVGGRKMTMIVSTLLTGIFLFLFTASKNAADVLGFSCASGLTQYVYLLLIRIPLAMLNSHFSKECCTFTPECSLSR
jgi:hypothetical protein